MHEQERLRRDRGRVIRRALYGVLAVCGVFAAGATGYAATGGWKHLLRVFSVNADQTITDESSNVVGTVTQNDDGTYTTRIMFDSTHGVETTTDEPLSPQQLKFMLAPHEEE